jgi:hypothetical protein
MTATPRKWAANTSKSAGSLVTTVASRTAAVAITMASIVMAASMSSMRASATPAAFAISVVAA